MSGFNHIVMDQECQVAFITVNRPDARNALNALTIKEIKTALERIRDQEDVRCIVFTGAGSKSFVSGADIAELRERVMLDALFNNDLYELFDAIENCAIPTIAMINGFALGGGLELALACDIRVVANKAKLGLPELNLAIIPGAGGTQRLSRIVGKGIALDMILTGKVIDGVEAARIGLASASVPVEQLKEKTMEIVQSIVSKGPLAIRMAKLSIHLGYETDMKTGQWIEKLAKSILYGTNDKAEGTAAFLEKRKPDYTGK